jgi:hypothetical protein
MNEHLLQASAYQAQEPVAPVDAPGNAEPSRVTKLAGPERAGRRRESSNDDGVAV